MRFWKRPEIITLLLATVVVTAIAANFWLDALQTRESAAADQRSRVVLQNLSALLDSLKDAETGQRGYLLTRQPKYLQPYRAAAAQVPGEIARLQQLLPRSAGAKTLARLVTSKMDEMGQTIDASKRVSFEAALSIVQTDRGQQDMDAIRALSQQLISEQYEALAQNSVHSEERGARARLIDIVGSIVLFALLAVSAVTIHRNTERREQLIEMLRQDDTRLRELGQQARDAESRMRTTLESIADGFVSFDSQFVITYVNAPAERILGRSKEDLLGRDFRAEFPDENPADMEARHQQVKETQTPMTCELYSEKRGTWVEESIYPAKDGGLSLFFRDITERKRLEERGRHTQKLESLGVLAGGIAHDFNNLLTAILGGASLLQEELPPDSAAAQHVLIVLNASERAAQLTRQMLAYSGRGRFVVERLDLSQQVREITQLLESSVPRDVELVLSLDANGILVEADSGQIQQLVMNLVINGAEAIENGPGTVVVSTRLEHLDADYVRDNMAGDNVLPGPYVLLEVHDTGKGMDVQTLGRIFDPFFTTKFTGRGLGLAAVIGIVRGHRGAIKVYSHVGHGTTFKVFFPVSPQQAAETIAPIAAVPLHGTETVLVVDDEETVQSMARVALEKYGYKVQQARNGREALSLFEQDPEAISLVLLDMTMPVMSGEETLKRLKAIRPALPVIASSGYNEIEALRRFGQGIQGFLQKPYRAAHLAEKVRGALGVRDSAVT